MSGGETKNISVAYFALLREQRGCEKEELATPAATPGDLYEELRARHGFTLSAALLMVAVNGEFGAWDTPLTEGDEVVFLPPVAGG